MLIKQKRLSPYMLRDYKSSLQDAIFGPKMEYFKYRENAMRAFELISEPGYFYSLAECPDLDIEFSDNKVLGKSQNLTPLG